MPDADAASHWQAVSPTPIPTVPLKGALTADVAIIGGGFTGLSAALHLAKSGRKVCVVEGRTIGWGGSGRNNGQVIPVLAGSEPATIEARFGAAGERFNALVRDSAAVLFDLVRAQAINCEAEQTGWFQPAHSRAHLRLSAARVSAWGQRGAECSLLDADECARLLGSGFWHGGMLNPTGGHINPLMLVRGLAAACERAGVVIHEDSPATGVHKVGAQWQVRTAAGQLTVDGVIMATNAYSGELAGQLQPEVARSVVPVTSWQMATPPLSAAQQDQIMPGRHAVSDTRADLHYFRYDARNQLVTGAALMLPFNPARRLTAHVGTRLATAFPQLGRVEFRHIWSGYVGVTPDRFPHFHQLGPNYLAAIGFNGRGVALAISAGREMAKALSGAVTQDIALPFSAVKPVTLHRLARRVARGAMLWYRWRDTRPPKG
ncbi:MAG: FAD-binding oxidoreductase [Rhodobacteraceae bacterium]|nr:FAD-binding oxidoreductase [Paracoccaceae bacterium]